MPASHFLQEFPCGSLCHSQWGDCQNVYQSLLKLSQPDEDERRHGWGFDSAMNFKRMGLPNEFWEMTEFNKNYELCSTYHSELGIPKTASKGTVLGSAKFRSRGCIPTLSYFHKRRNAAICRCSQPLSGLTV
ncbi:unnamed protein product [Oncorhynchus mykiss]|uniref:Myotubularin phosphatase domain-containing protein n=1 Tax=Oncorhynchus mykiss TaxID=8022 RepID=A0A060W6B8_ONCMY|nr:unnamed protein product [Oncorhynchus mykiss]